MIVTRLTCHIKHCRNTTVVAQVCSALPKNREIDSPSFSRQDRQTYRSQTKLEFPCTVLAPAERVRSKMAHLLHHLYEAEREPTFLQFTFASREKPSATVFTISRKYLILLSELIPPGWVGTERKRRRCYPKGKSCYVAGRYDGVGGTLKYRRYVGEARLVETSVEYFPGTVSHN